MNEPDEHCSDDSDEKFWGQPLPQPDSGWALACSCIDGHFLWTPQWKAIENATRCLWMLEELHGHKPDWDLLLAGFKHLQVLKDPAIDWPPLHQFKDFLLIGDFFLPFEGSNDWSVGQLLYIVDHEPKSTKPLMEEFDELSRRLRAYPPLAPFTRWM